VGLCPTMIGWWANTVRHPYGKAHPTTFIIKHNSSKNEELSLKIRIFHSLTDYVDLYVIVITIVRLKYTVLNGAD
jgi:hypothetical protein